MSAAAQICGEVVRVSTNVLVRDLDLAVTDAAEIGVMKLWPRACRLIGALTDMNLAEFGRKELSLAEMCLSQARISLFVWL